MSSPHSPGRRSPVRFLIHKVSRVFDHRYHRYAAYI
jgi:hypothetical protein